MKIGSKVNLKKKWWLHPRGGCGWLHPRGWTWTRSLLMNGEKMVAAGSEQGGQSDGPAFYFLEKVIEMLSCAR